MFVYLACSLCAFAKPQQCRAELWCRLKSAQGNKTISALTSLNCPRRIILTGTPIQNNLQVGDRSPALLASTAVLDFVHHQLKGMQIALHVCRTLLWG